MRNFVNNVRTRIRGAARSYRSTRAGGGGFFSAVRNAVRYAVSGAGRGG